MLLCTCWMGWASAQQNRTDSSFAQQRQQAESPILLALPADAPTVVKLKKRLVELALQTPDMKQYTIRKEINKYEGNKATAEWLNHFNVNGNVNEFTLKQQRGDVNNNFYPRYNFGVSVPLGNLVAIPNEIKRVKANSRLLDVQKESDAMTIRSKVLKAYEDYAANKQLVELQQPLLEDALNHYKRIEEKFSAGEKDVSVEAFNEAYRMYNGEMVKKVTLERDLRQSKIDLEGMIGGITLEEVLRQLK